MKIGDKVRMKGSDNVFTVRGPIAGTRDEFHVMSESGHEYWSRGEHLKPVKRGWQLGAKFKVGDWLSSAFEAGEHMSRATREHVANPCGWHVWTGCPDCDREDPHEHATQSVRDAPGNVLPFPGDSDGQKLFADLFGGNWQNQAAQASQLGNMLSEVQPNSVFNYNRKPDVESLAKALFRVRMFDVIAAKSEVNVSGCGYDAAEWSNREAATKFLRVEAIMWDREDDWRNTAIADARNALQAMGK